MARASRHSCRGDGAHGGSGEDPQTNTQCPTGFQALATQCRLCCTGVVLTWQLLGTAAKKKFSQRARERVGGQVLMWPHRQSSVVDCAGVAGMPDLEGGHRENGAV